MPPKKGKGKKDKKSKKLSKKDKKNAKSKVEGPEPCVRPGVPIPLPIGTLLELEGNGEFYFGFGGHYIGGFHARLLEDSLCRQGRGMYLTAEGIIYSGNWERDALDGPKNKIEFPDKSHYCGTFKNGKYHDIGKYTFADGSYLVAHFINNKPHEKLFYTDKNGYLWIGSVCEDGSLTFRKHITHQRVLRHYITETMVPNCLSETIEHVILKVTE